MKRFYFFSDDLDELAQVEQELKSAGIATPQIHVVSRDDAGAERRGLHKVQDFMRRDVVRTGFIGAGIGMTLALVILFGAYLSNAPEKVTWIPFIFFALIALGFCTWEGGLFGLHRPHHELRKMEKRVSKGQHVLFVDMEPQKIPVLHRIQARHQGLQSIGEGAATPEWVVRAQQKWQEFVKVMP
jgi:hypothetical protein